MSTDDGDIEDDGLKSLRAVWLSMPDEDPPQRGLAELMAAARVKADEMAAAQPSLWERFLGMMRRPQVLALATIMILIGGAVFISQRRDKLQAGDPSAVSETSTAQPGAPTTESAVAGSGAPAVPAVTRELADKKEAEQAAPVTPTPAPDGVGRDDSKLAAPRPERPADQGQATEKRKAPVSKKSKGSVNDDLDSPLDLEAGDAVGKTGASAGPSGGGGAGGGGTGTSTTVGGVTTGTTAGGKTEPKADPTTASDTGVEDEKQDPAVKKLHDQARAAAAKGDCATARTLAKQIAARDAQYYRANIAQDRSLAGCLK